MLNQTQAGSDSARVPPLDFLQLKQGLTVKSLVESIKTLQRKVWSDDRRGMIEEVARLDRKVSAILSAPNSEEVGYGRSEAEIRERIEYLETKKAAYLFPLDHEFSKAHQTVCFGYECEREALYWALGERTPRFTPYCMFEYYRKAAAGGAV